MGYPKIVEDAKCVMYLKFHKNMPYGLFHATFVIIEQPLLVLPHLQQPVHCLIFLITRTIKQDDLAAAFSATSLSELEQNYSSGLVVENNMSLFAEIPKYFYFA